MDDKQRIAEIMRIKNLTAKNFAEVTGISPATLSHILNGRTNPTLAIFKSVINTFPEFNPMWVAFGTGDMYRNSDSVAFNSGSDEPAKPVADPKPANDPIQENDGLLSFNFDAPEEAVLNPAPSAPEKTVQQPKTIIKEVVKNIDKKPRKIVEIRVFFDDGTYETFN